MPLDQTNWKQDTETKPDVFSLEGLITWLERQPAETEYCFTDTGDCLLARYLKGAGLPFFSVSADNWTDTNNYTRHQLPGRVSRDKALRVGYFGTCLNPLNVVASTHPHTFGAVLSRARALPAETRK